MHHYRCWLVALAGLVVNLLSGGYGSAQGLGDQAEASSARIARTFCGGSADNFICPIEPASPKSSIVNLISGQYSADSTQCYTFLDFDEVPLGNDCDTVVIPANAWFVHNIPFVIPPAGLGTPLLKFRVKAGAGSQTATDFISFWQGTTYITGSTFKTLPGSGGAWNSFQDMTFTLDLSQLPAGFSVGDIRPYMLDGDLDIVIGNETGVDWMCLELPRRVKVNTGWNILSNVTADPRHRNDLFPMAVSSAFGYTEGGYAPSDTLIPGAAYWLKYAGNGTVDGLGDGTDSLVIPVSGGWNMISPNVDDTGMVAIIPSGTSLTSQFYTFEGGYVAVLPESIKAGQGVWVKASGAGSLQVTSGGGIANPASQAHVKEGEFDPDRIDRLFSRLNALRFSGRSDGRRDLFFGGQIAAPLIAAYGELPPVPPPEAFDVRFASGRFAEFVPQEIDKVTDLVITLAPAEYPVIIKPILREASPHLMTLIVEIDGQAVAGYTIQDGGEIRLTDNRVTKLILRFESAVTKPISYSLTPNYPNPFNPTTSIKYQLPVESHVNLIIYNALGEVVSTLVDETQVAGFRVVEWNAQGKSSGIYYARFEAIGVDGSSAAYSQVEKMILLK